MVCAWCLLRGGRARAWFLHGSRRARPSGRAAFCKMKGGVVDLRAAGGRASKARRRAAQGRSGRREAAAAPRGGASRGPSRRPPRGVAAAPRPHMISSSVSPHVFIHSLSNIPPFIHRFIVHWFMHSLIIVYPFVSSFIIHYLFIYLIMNYSLFID